MRSLEVETTHEVTALMRDPCNSGRSTKVPSWPLYRTSARWIVHAGLSCLAIQFSASLHAQINLDFEALAVDEAASGLPSGWDAQDEDA